MFNQPRQKERIAALGKFLISNLQYLDVQLHNLTAVAGVAYGYEFPNEGTFESPEISSGRAKV
jgi:hypothetical protein